MKSRLLPTRPLAATLIPFLFALPVSARAAAPALETINVTAHRLPTDAAVLPVAARDLRDAPAVGLAPLRDLPSLSISQSGSLGSLTQVRVRGAEANHLLVLLDGIELMDPTTDSGFNLANLNLAGIDRLEFLPGAQSAVWGSDAVAGVLQLSSRPDADARRLTVEGGSFDTRAASVRIAAERDRYYYNVSLADFSTQGTNIARSGSEEDGYDNGSVLLSGGTEGERWAVRGLLRRVKTASDFDPTPFPTFRPSDGDLQNRHHETLAAIGADVSGSERAWTERLTVAWFDTGNRTLTDGRRSARTEGSRWEISSVTRLPLSPRQQFDLLLEHERETFDQQGEPSVFGDPNQSQTIRTSSAGLEYRLALSQRMQLAASGRFDHSSEFEDSTSVRLAGSFALAEASRVWLALGNGIKHPSFVERYGFTPDSFIGNPDLHSEENRHVSLGLEHAAGGWRIGATAYRDRLKDEIDGFFFDPAAGGFTAVNRAGTSRRQGAELELSRRWTQTEARVGVSYLHAVEPDGQREIRRPRWQGYLHLTQHWRLADLSLSVFQVDQQLDLDFAEFPAPRVALDGYTLIDTRLRVPVTRRVDLTLRGSNLLDERYEDQIGYRSPGRAFYLQLGIDL